MSAVGAETVSRVLPRHVAWAERIGEERERRRVDAERLRIARELHDVVAYGFATISLQAGVAAQVAGERPEQVLEALQAIKAASKEALEELRGILGLLRHAEGPRDSAPGLSELDALVRTTTNAGVSTDLRISGLPSALPPAIDHAVYRIVQEALTNVLRHAGPSSARVSLSLEGNRLRISVEDDGSGDGGAREQAFAEPGYGIVGMRERARALGGDVEAAARDEGGFRVTACLPLAAGL
jgi:signal transduction histidine kinase